MTESLTEPKTAGQIQDFRNVTSETSAVLSIFQVVWCVFRAPSSDARCLSPIVFVLLTSFLSSSYFPPLILVL